MNRTRSILKRSLQRQNSLQNQIRSNRRRLFRDEFNHPFFTSHQHVNELFNEFFTSDEDREMLSLNIGSHRTRRSQQHPMDSLMNVFYDHPFFNNSTNNNMTTQETEDQQHHSKIDDVQKTTDSPTAKATWGGVTTSSKVSNTENENRDAEEATLTENENGKNEPSGVVNPFQHHSFSSFTSSSITRNGETLKHSKRSFIDDDGCLIESEEKILPNGKTLLYERKEENGNVIHESRTLKNMSEHIDENESTELINQFQKEWDDASQGKHQETISNKAIES